MGRGWGSGEAVMDRWVRRSLSNCHGLAGETVMAQLLYTTLHYYYYYYYYYCTHTHHTSLAEGETVIVLAGRSTYKS